MTFHTPHTPPTNQDNGAPVDIAESGGNNWPLRGGKYSAFEGGVRGNAFVSGGYLPPSVRGTVSSSLMHIADWYTTYCGLAGGSPEWCTSDPAAAASGLPPVDGLDLWPLLSGATGGVSPRLEVPIDIAGPSPALIQGDYKLLVGKQGIAGWEGPIYPNASSTSAAANPYSYTLHCSAAGGPGACLFNVATDPTEQNDIAAQHPQLVRSMLARLAELAPSFYSNNETGVDVPLCAGKPAGMPCACYLAMPGNKWNGFLGPYQV